MVEPVLEPVVSYSNHYSIPPPPLKCASEYHVALVVEVSSIVLVNTCHFNSDDDIKVPARHKAHIQVTL